MIEVVASDGDDVIGIATADIDGHVAHLRSLFVEPAHRRRGVARGLLRELEARLRAGGVGKVDGFYDGSTAVAPIVAHILEEAGWHQPISGMLICRASARILEAPWMRARAPADVDVFDWGALEPAERAVLASADWYPQALAPCGDPPADPICSVGARRAGEIVGWMLTERVEPDVLRYGRLFVHPAHRRGMLGVALIAEAIRRQTAAGVRSGMFGVRTDNRGMARFVKKRIAPFADSVEETRYAEKTL